MTPTDPKVSVTARIYCGDKVAVGPEQAKLLEAIQQEGSISAAGRAIGLAYRTTWLMVDEMNRCWKSPLVVASIGGVRGGGAKLSKLGLNVLEHYQNMQRLLDIVSRGQPLSALVEDVREFPKPAKNE